MDGNRKAALDSRYEHFSDGWAQDHQHPENLTDARLMADLDDLTEILAGCSHSGYMGLMSSTAPGRAHMALIREIRKRLRMDDLHSVESHCQVCGGHGVLKAVETSAAHSTVVLTCSRCGIGFRATVPAGDAKAIQEAKRDLLRHWNRRPATPHHADGEPSDGHSCPFCGSHSVAVESYSLFLDQRKRIVCGACGAATKGIPAHDCILADGKTRYDAKAGLEKLWECFK